jgi:hypothetical protein
MNINGFSNKFAKKIPDTFFSWFMILALAAFLSACSVPPKVNPTAPVKPSQIPLQVPSPTASSTTLVSTAGAPSIIPSFPATQKPTFTPTVPPPTGTAAPPSPTSTETSTPSPTPPPAGVFAIKFNPPLVLDYSTDQWIDKTEYVNTEKMVNTLQYRELESCSIGPMGPSGFYPDKMKEVRLGSIDYQILPDQKTTGGNAVSYYFALRTSNGSIENDVGIAHFSVQSSPAESKQCRAAAEEVLGTLRRATQPKY